MGYPQDRCAGLQRGGKPIAPVAHCLTVVQNSRTIAHEIVWCRVVRGTKDGGMEKRYLGWLITTRPSVQIRLPLPEFARTGVRKGWAVSGDSRGLTHAAEPGLFVASQIAATRCPHGDRWDRCRDLHHRPSR